MKTQIVDRQLLINVMNLASILEVAESRYRKYFNTSEWSVLRYKLMPASITWELVCKFLTDLYSKMHMTVAVNRNSWSSPRQICNSAQWPRIHFLRYRGKPRIPASWLVLKYILNSACSLWRQSCKSASIPCHASKHPVRYRILSSGFWSKEI